MACDLLFSPDTRIVCSLAETSSANKPSFDLDLYISERAGVSIIITHIIIMP